MKLSMEHCILRDRFGDKTGIKMIKDAGFDAFDYSFYGTNEKNDILGDNYAEIAKDLRKYIDEIGIECNQAHAPFEFRYNENKIEISDNTYLRIVRSMEFASILGAKNIIIHSIKTPENEFTEYNYKFYKSLEPFCEKFGICISVENLFSFNDKGCCKGRLCNPKEHCDFVESLNSKWFNICIDVGHSAITGYEPEYIIESINNGMLQALHIHDNDYRYDLHQLPYLGKFNWDNITCALSKINYSGDFTFETISFIQSFDNELMPYALKLIEQTGRLLIKKTENNFN